MRQLLCEPEDRLDARMPFGNVDPGLSLSSGGTVRGSKAPSMVGIAMTMNQKRLSGMGFPTYGGERSVDGADMIKVSTVVRVSMMRGNLNDC